MTHEKQERRYRYGPGAPCVDEIERDGATPGPWHVHPDGSTVEYETGIGGRRTLLSLNWRGTEETAANAKLIAAAPELADALEAMCEWIGPPPRDRHSFDSQREDAWEAARAALRKAGRE